MRLDRPITSVATAPLLLLLLLPLATALLPHHLLSTSSGKCPRVVMTAPVTTYARTTSQMSASPRDDYGADDLKKDLRILAGAAGRIFSAIAPKVKGAVENSVGKGLDFHKNIPGLSKQEQQPPPKNKQKEQEKKPEQLLETMKAKVHERFIEKANDFQQIWQRKAVEQESTREQDEEPVQDKGAPQEFTNTYPETYKRFDSIRPPSTATKSAAVSTKKVSSQREHVQPQAQQDTPPQPRHQPQPQQLHQPPRPREQFHHRQQPQPWAGRSARHQPEQRQPPPQRRAPQPFMATADAGFYSSTSRSKADYSSPSSSSNIHNSSNNHALELIVQQAVRLLQQDPTVMELCGSSLRVGRPFFQSTNMNRAGRPEITAKVDIWGKAGGGWATMTAVGGQLTVLELAINGEVYDLYVPSSTQHVASGHHHQHHQPHRGGATGGAARPNFNGYVNPNGPSIHGKPTNPNVQSFAANGRNQHHMFIDDNSGRRPSQDFENFINGNHQVNNNNGRDNFGYNGQYNHESYIRNNHPMDHVSNSNGLNKERLDNLDFYHADHRYHADNLQGQYYQFTTYNGRAVNDIYNVDENAMREIEVEILEGIRRPAGRRNTVIEVGPDGKINVTDPPLGAVNGTMF